MSEEPTSVSERMRSDWNERAREDAHYYVAFGGRDQDEAGFLATAGDVVRSIEAELQRFPKRPDSPSLTALEIGCGPGRLMKLLSRHFGEIHGVDVSDEMIRLARERLRDISHAHAHATSGASLTQFANESFDFVYSYAVFQHIPSRDVVLEYMSETRRVLKPGGIFHGQFNGLPHDATPDTWSGVTFSEDDIRNFTHENGFQLLNLNGAGTQYMWTTWRKKPVAETERDAGPPSIRRVTNAYSGEPLIPNRGRHAAISVWTKNLPAECDLNNLEILVEGAHAFPLYIGPPASDGLQQVNAWLPDTARTGLLAVELLVAGNRIAPPATARIVPAGPLIPRIVSISDGINLIERNASSSGILKIQIEEVSVPAGTTTSIPSRDREGAIAESPALAVTIDGRPVDWIEIKCIDPRPPRHEINLRLPKGLLLGPHNLEIRIGSRLLLPAQIVVRPGSGPSTTTSA
jgi:SAM-dependent methyltransferase